MGFILYDLTFLVLFTLFVVIFLYKRRKNLKREGLLYLYRTQVGVKFIDWATKKYPRFWKKAEYIVLASGYFLMFAGIWFILKVAYLYITSPYIAKALKIPVVMPLIPYLPEIFKIDFLPPFYFTYWIIIIAIIAIPHEFAHGIFARLNKIGIKSTGFGFLGPFLAAFVEQDDKQMQKAKKFSQLSVLAAGTFANVIMTVLFGLILFIFFTLSFVPAGVQFNVYSLSAVNASSISISDNFLDNSTLLEIKSNNKTYFADAESLNSSLSSGQGYVVAFDDSPALRTQLSGAISRIDGKKITSYKELNSTLSSYKPGDQITIQTIDVKTKEIKEQEIILGNKDGRAFLGIGLMSSPNKGALSWLSTLLGKIKNPFIYYESRIGDLGIFIFDLLWWAVVISLSVALVNMLPLGIFDGGRFFYLTVWAITKREKVAKWAFKISTWFMLALVAMMLTKWLFAII
jgi:membrane-associated protease RseP (regulator of RpoE activity)